MSSRNFIFKRGFKSKSERISDEFRRILDLKPYSPLPARQLAEYLNIEIIPPLKVPGMTKGLLRIINKSKEWSAITIQLFNKKLLMIHNDKNSILRQESDIMHELAHVIYKHSFDGIQLSNSSIILRNYNLDHEKEAEWLGGCLQLNRDSLLWCLRKKMNVKAISEHFCASKVMVTFRMNVTGVAKQYPYFNPFN